MIHRDDTLSSTAGSTCHAIRPAATKPSARRPGRPGSPPDGLRRRSERLLCPRLVVSGIVERTLGLTLMNIGQVIKHLPQRPHRRRQLPDHPIHLRRLIEPPTRVRQPPQRLQGRSSIDSRIEERRHGDLLEQVG